MKKSQKTFIIILLIIILLLGIACVVYPAFSSWYNERTKAQVMTEYMEAMEKLDNQKISDAKAAAIEHNRKLFYREIAPNDPYGNGYFQQLNLSGNGIMGYIRIPKIDVHLAIYHSAEEPAISLGAGHLPETSLPIGGENTHSALSAHSGMASNALFSELERLKVGDYFYIDILGETLTYKIMDEDDIIAVLPHETEHLVIEPGEDLITLITCVPYSVNTHRLLVTGTRVETISETLVAEGEADGGILPEKLSVRTTNYIKGILIGLFCAVTIICVVSIIVILLRRRKQDEEETEESPAEISDTIILSTQSSGWCDFFIDLRNHDPFDPSKECFANKAFL